MKVTSSINVGKGMSHVYQIFSSRPPQISANLMFIVLQTLSKDLKVSLLYFSKIFHDFDVPHHASRDHLHAAVLQLGE